MSKETLRIIVEAAMVGFALALTGCTAICRQDQRTGFATILCQPVDVVVRSTNQPVSFKVVAAGCGLSYRWYRNDQPLDAVDEKRGEYKNVFGPELMVLGEKKYIAASYSCEIGSKDFFGDDQRTHTRSAFLDYQPDYALRLLIVTPPTANLPRPGAPQNYSNFEYCAFAKFTGIRPSGTNTAPTYCQFQLNMVTPPTPQPVPTSFYAVKVLDGKSHAVQVNDVDAYTKGFTLTASPYVITVYYNCANCPAGGGTLSLDAKWLSP